MKKDFLALILAAGKGTRFKSEKIKVLHTLMGKSMVRLVVDSVIRLNPDNIYVVVGYQKDDVMKEPFAKNVSFITQQKQLGTAHAVLKAKSVLENYPEKDLLIINSDLPLIRPETLRPFLNHHRKEGHSCTFLTADLENPTGFGRVVYAGDQRIRIIEERDATPAQRRMKEVNVGIYLFKIKDLLHALPKISNQNKKGEYYLTDTVEIMTAQGKKISAFKTVQNEEIIGVNDRYELALAVDVLRRRKIKALTESGVTIYDPVTTWIDLDVKIGEDTTIYSSVIIEDNSVIGNRCTLYPFVHIVNSKVGNRVKIFTSTMVEESIIEDGVQLGPFSHLRPKTVLKQDAKVGNFVEMKNTVFGSRSKAGHLSYLGDTDVGKDVNIGAGTIVCNYDGIKKHKTSIGDASFIGSGTELVAPLKIGKNAYVGAGSTITENVSDESLAVARSKQVEKPGWARKKRKK